MSHQMRPVSTVQVICDLCDEPISEERAYKRASLVHGYGGNPDKAKAPAWYLLWDPRNWPGGPPWDQRQANPEKWRTRTYDFHTECLLRVVEKAIADRGFAEVPDER